MAPLLPPEMSPAGVAMPLKTTTPEKNPALENAEQRKPRFGSIVLSTLAAALGVQSNKNRERDFREGNIYVFIIAGLIFSLAFVLGLVLVVRLVLAN